MADVRLHRQVVTAEAGGRLDVVLAQWIGQSRSQAQGHITAGLVTVDGRPSAKSDRLAEGQMIRVVEPAPPAPPPPPPPVPIRYADEHLVVVCKPADLVVHAGAGVRGATLVDALIAQGVPLAEAEDPARPGIVHRLDRGTSGLLVIASTTVALHALQEVFRAHDVRREYWTLVEGWPDPPKATIDAPIIRSTSNRTAFTTGDAGRPAQTHYDTIAVHRADGPVSLDTAEVELTLETGRTHQVRVHLRAIGRPVAGDLLYNGSADLARELGLSRQALHARRLAFDHPVTGARIDLEEPLPADLAHARAMASRASGDASRDQTISDQTGP